MRNVVYIGLIILLFSCEKAEDRSCFKSAGDANSKRVVELETFEKLHLGAEIKYTLVQDGENKIVVKGYKNLVNLVTAEVTDKTLDIQNTNECNFLRNYDKNNIEVEIHFNHVYNIEYYGTESMTSKGTLEFDWLTFQIIEGAGPVDLSLNALSIAAGTDHGYGDFTFRGTTNELSIDCRNNGYFNTLELIPNESVEIKTKSPVLSKANFGNAAVKVTINSSGDIEYKGEPSSLTFTQNGTGNLVDVN